MRYSQFLKVILVTLLPLNCKNPTIGLGIERVLNEVLSVQFPNEKCAILFTNISTLINDKWQYQTLQLRGSSLMGHLPLLTCVTALVTEKDSLPGVVEVMNNVLRGIIIYYGSEQIVTNQFGYINKPIIWHRARNSNNSLLGDYSLTYCQRQDKSIGKIINFTNITNNNTILTSGCPTYLDGQTLKVAYIPGMSTGSIRNGKVYPGHHTTTIEYLAAKFHFRPSYQIGSNVYNRANSSWGGTLKQLEDGDIFMNYGSHGSRYTSKFDLMYPHYFSDMVFISRAPRPAGQYKSVYLPFDKTTWQLIYSHLFLMSLAFLAIHTVYSRSLKDARLHNVEDSKTNFLLFTVFRFTEPENIPWFTQNWSTGKFLVFLWIWFSVFIVSFYNSNLRAHLTAIKYEDSIDTLSDVLENGKRPWILNEAVTMQKRYFELIGQVDTTLYKISLLALETGGYFTFNDYGRFPPHALQDIVDNHAVGLLAKEALPHMRRNSVYKDILQGDLLHATTEPAVRYKHCMLLKKHNPMSYKINQAVMDAVEAGLIQKSLTYNLPMEATLEATMKSQKQDSRQPLLMNHIIFPLRFWALLLLIALVAFLLEVTYWQYQIKTKARKSQKGISVLKRFTSYLGYLLEVKRPKRSRQELLRIYSMGENKYGQDGHTVLVSDEF